MLLLVSNHEYDQDIADRTEQQNEWIDCQLNIVNNVKWQIIVTSVCVIGHFFSWGWSFLFISF